MSRIIRNTSSLFSSSEQLNADPTQRAKKIRIRKAILRWAIFHGVKNLGGRLENDQIFIPRILPRPTNQETIIWYIQLQVLRVHFNFLTSMKCAFVSFQLSETGAFTYTTCCPHFSSQGQFSKQNCNKKKNTQFCFCKHLNSTASNFVLFGDIDKKNNELYERCHKQRWNQFCHL